MIGNFFIVKSIQVSWSGSPGRDTLSYNYYLDCCDLAKVIWLDKKKVLLKNVKYCRNKSLNRLTIYTV